ncbi:MAG TPA: PAS domain S-box protein [Chryseolinea sp.]|nr:PAS domain S-box protein [Chryseolinea sp.]
MEQVNLKLLMLEDNQDDAILIRRILTRANINFEARVVSNREDFIDALDAYCPDLVLSDHQLPQFTSSKALEIARDKFPNIPFILVTGAVSEEFAVSIIKQGADDYLLKSNLGRLPTAIRQVVEKRRTQASLQKLQEAKEIAEFELKGVHERLLFHLENTPLGNVEWDNHFLVKSWSKRSEEIFGWSEQEFMSLQMTGFSTVYEEDLPRIVKMAQQLLCGEIERNNVQYRNYTKDGRVIWCDWFNSVKKDKDGRVITIMSLVQDITTRKSFEEILREYHDRYQILSKATNDAIWDWQMENDVIVWNHGIQTIFGYSDREITTNRRWWQERLLGDDYDRVINEMNKAIAAGVSNVTMEYQFRCSDGTYKHVYDRGYIIFEQKKPVRMIGVMQDITKQKEFIQEIEKLSLVASKTNNAVVITDAHDKIEWVNEGFIKLTGYTLQEIVGLKPGHFLQGENTDETTVRRIAAKLEDEESFTEEIINYAKNGRKYWVRLDISPVFNNEGVLKHFIAIQTDISRQKEFENQITNIARDLSSLIENANVPIFGIDRNGYVNEWNRIAAELSGYDRNEVLERKWHQLFDQTTQEKLDGVLTKAFTGIATQNFELPLTEKAGTDLILLISISPRMNSNRDIYGAICVGQDITELFRYRQGLENLVKERTYELNEALLKEKELVELKGKFVSIASHEFRTPLSTISLATGVIKKYYNKLSSTEFQAKLETIETQVRNMTYLLDDVLTVGKGEAGKILTTYSSVAIEAFFANTAKEVEQSKGTHKIRVRINCTIKTFRSDEKLLRNIVINLLTNAIKFSDMIKTVHLSVYNTPEWLIVDVEDKGIGIAQGDMENIFTAFQRGSNVGSIEGTGLGLSIVKKAVDLLKGEIKVQSKVSKGTTFTVRLPLAV